MLSLRDMAATERLYFSDPFLPRFSALVASLLSPAGS